MKEGGLKAESGESQPDLEKQFARFKGNSDSDKMTATGLIEAIAREALAETFDPKDWNTLIVTRPYFATTDKKIITGASTFIVIAQNLKLTEIQRDFLVGSMIHHQTEKIIKKEKQKKDDDLVLYQKVGEEERIEIKPQQYTMTRDERLESLKNKVDSIGANLDEKELEDMQLLVPFIFDIKTSKSKLITILKEGQTEEFWKRLRSRYQINQ